MDPVISTSIAAIVGPIVGAGAVIVGQYLAASAADEREEKRQAHERDLKALELEGERLQAISKLFISLCEPIMPIEFEAERGKKFPS